MTQQMTSMSKEMGTNGHGGQMKAIVVTDQAAGTAGMKLVERPEPQGRRSIRTSK